MNHRHTLRTAIALACAGTLASEAVAGDYSLVVRGTVTTFTTALPAPYDAAGLGDKVHLTFSVFDQPDLSVPDVAVYPADLSECILTVGGVAGVPTSGVLPDDLTLLDNLAGVGDRIAVRMGTPWGSGLILAAYDDATSTLFDQLDIGNLLGLRPTNPSQAVIRLFGPTGPALDVTIDEMRFVDGSAISPTCLGDGSAAACPCSNPGGLGQGCANSAGAGGLLSGLGSASLAANDLGFWADQLPASTPAVLFAGITNVSGGNGLPFGAGRRCAGRELRRVGLRMTDADGQATWDADVLGMAGALAGQTLTFQVWYADAAGACMGRPYNATQAFEVAITP